MTSRHEVAPRQVTMREVLSVLTSKRAISLEELNAEASFQSRIDRKYVLSRRDARAVLARLPDDAQVLEIGGRRTFGYRSVYFDTPDLHSYIQAAHRRRRRFKVRTRTYLDTGTDWLEVKTRAARGTTVKQRIEHFEGPTHLGSGHEFVADILANERIDTPATALRAGLVTRYRRTTMFLPGVGTSARATVDTDLTWTDGPLSLTAADAVVIETKTGSQPSPLDFVLWRHGHRPQRISKYGTGLALMRPDLPRTPWKRVIRRHFDDTGQVGARVAPPAIGPRNLRVPPSGLASQNLRLPPDMRPQATRPQPVRHRPVWHAVR